MSLDNSAFCLASKSKKYKGDIKMKHIKNTSRVLSLLLIIALAVTGLVGPAQAQPFPNVDEPPCELCEVIYFFGLLCALLELMPLPNDLECVDTSLPNI